jgi:hypothetical protein
LSIDPTRLTPKQKRSQQKQLNVEDNQRDQQRMQDECLRKVKEVLGADQWNDKQIRQAAKHNSYDSERTIDHLLSQRTFNNDVIEEKGKNKEN